MSLRCKIIVLVQDFERKGPIGQCAIEGTLEEDTIDIMQETFCTYATGALQKCLDARLKATNMVNPDGNVEQTIHHQPPPEEVQ